jgi:hypothetical protein
LERKLTEKEIELIEKDYATFEGYSLPKDNLHMTSLFLGKNKDKHKPQEKQILNNWKHGVKHPLCVDFIAYVPHHLLAGSISDLGKIDVANKCPHMTLLLRENAKAV